MNMISPPQYNRSRPRGAMAGTALVTLAAITAGALLLGQGTGEPASTTKAEAPAPAPPKVKPSVITSVPPGTVYNQREQLLERGHLVYNKYCVGCHGAQGDGKGVAAARLLTKPRDFTREIYKFRSTDSSSLPMEADLHRTITRGLARVSMPAFPLMAEQDKVAVIQYIKQFYAKWDEEAPSRKLVFVPNAPADLKDKSRIDRGRLVYLAMGCANCHGKDGAGTDAVQQVFTDAWGNPQIAFNFTRGRLKSGDNPEDIYRVFHGGLRSIMPAFPGETLAYVSAEQVTAAARFFVEGEPASFATALTQIPATTADVVALTADQRMQQATTNSWDLVAYIQSLRAGGGKATGKAAAKAPPAGTTSEDY